MTDTIPDIPSIRSLKQRAPRLIPLLSLGLASVPFSVVQAESGTWILNGSDTWSVSNTSPWAEVEGVGVVAQGADFTADFSTIDITGDRTVTLTESQTIGNLKFGDTTSSHGWTLARTGTSTILTLQTTSGAPTITVNSLASGKTATISAVLGGNQGFIKEGTGVLVLSGDNTTTGELTGTATVNAGTLRVANSNAVANVNIASGGILNVDNNDVTLSGAISGAGTLTKTNNSKTLTLNGDLSAFTGTVEITAGGLILGSNSSLGGSSSTFKLSGSGISGGGGIQSSDNTKRTIDSKVSMGSNSLVFGAAQGATTGLGDIEFTDTVSRTIGGSKTWTVTNSTTVTFNNSWSANSGWNITKAGTGMLVFNGNLGSSFNGTTTVSAGTLVINASKTGAGANIVNNGGTLLVNGNLGSSSTVTGGVVTVNAGGTFGGSGTVWGATAISGTLSPGNPATTGITNSPGTLTFKSSLTLESTATTLLEIAGAELYDSIDVAGGFTYGGAATVSLLGGFSLTSGQTYNLFKFNSGSPTGAFETFTVTGTSLGGSQSLTKTSWGFEETIGDLTYTFTNATGILEVAASAIPEPSTYAAIAGALALGAVLIRRRRRAQA